MGSHKQLLQPSEHSRSSLLLLPSSTSYSSHLPTPLQPATIPCNHTLSIRHTNTVMPADAVRSLSATKDVERIEAPVTWKAYLMCAFASFGGIFFGYDSGYINGVNGATALGYNNLTLITSILSVGTFFGAVIAGDVAEWIGRKWTVILGCVIYMVGVVVQMITSPEHALGPIVAGRLIAGLGVGFESAIVILYMSEICPKKVRGALVAGYQFCITIGLLLAACVNYGVKEYQNSAEYRVPIGLQFIFGLVLGVGLFFLPDSPRYYVKRGRVEKARKALSSVRGQPQDSEYVEAELAEIIANEG